jgi:GcrA cell cycle regulator
MPRQWDHLDATEKLLALYTDGTLSAAEIGERLGCTATTVMSMARRLYQQGILPPRLALAHRLAHPSTGRPTRLSASRPPPAAPRRPMPSRQITCPCQFNELAAYNCRWPLGERGDAAFHFCGAFAVAGSPYCPTHTVIARQPGIAERRGA